MVGLESYQNMMEYEFELIEANPAKYLRVGGQFQWEIVFYSSKATTRQVHACFVYAYL